MRFLGGRYREMIDSIEKKGWVKKMPNGGEAIDIIKVHAHNEKINALMLLVCLGNNSK
jgi:hypothetical protein